MTGGAGDLNCLGALVGRTEGSLVSALACSAKPASTLTPFTGIGDAADALRDAGLCRSSFVFGLPERRAGLVLGGGWPLMLAFTCCCCLSKALLSIMMPDTAEFSVGVASTAADGLSL